MIEGEGLLWEGDVPCSATLLTEVQLVRALQERRFAGPDAPDKPGVECTEAVMVLRCMSSMSCLLQDMRYSA